MQGPDSSRHSLSVALGTQAEASGKRTEEASGGQNRPDSENISQVGSRRIFYAMLRREINGKIKRMKRQTGLEN